MRPRLPTALQAVLCPEHLPALLPASLEARFLSFFVLFFFFLAMQFLFKSQAWYLLSCVNIMNLGTFPHERSASHSPVLMSFTRHTFPQCHTHLRMPLLTQTSHNLGDRNTRERFENRTKAVCVRVSMCVHARVCVHVCA